ncbi:MAG: type transport system ATP-binding protein [Jatrophihabitantaceae bacterium]|nr:type transport system ATP-binding protein [Jatrophihabitantaceae bacterium]
MPQPGTPSADAGRIVVTELSKQFKNVLAVNRLSFTVEPGSVTGFLGPNGAGKTTTLRMLLGLIQPTGGTATIGGQRYSALHDPLRLVGAALEASSFHPARTGRNHLRIYCAAAGLPDRRADEVLDLVGLGNAGKRKVRGYSMGMRQRLGLAATLLGDPRVLILDEPANGLDPEGIRWLRGFFTQLASEGRTVLVSSHQLAEIQAVADRVVILNRGTLVRSGSIAELTAGQDSVIVRGPNLEPLLPALTSAGGTGQRPDANTVEVRGLDLAQIGHLAFTSNVELHELSERRFDLEQLFFSLTQGEYTGQSMGAAPVGPMGGTPSLGQGGTPPAGYQQPPGYQAPPPGYAPPGYAQPGYTPEAGR